MLHRSWIRRDLALALCAVAITFSAPAAHPVDEAANVARLSLEVQRAEDIRAVKRLQITYAQYVQFGLWSQAGFALRRQCRGESSGPTVSAVGPRLAEFLLNTWGNGREGLPAGGLHTLLEDTPVLNLSADGRDRQGPMARILADRTIWRQRALGTRHHREQLHEGGGSLEDFPRQLLSGDGWPIRDGLGQCRFCRRFRAVSLHVRRGGEANPADSGRACGSPRSKARPRPRSPRSTCGFRR